MVTQAEHARRGNVTDEMRAVATQENLPVATVVEKVASGEAVILANPRHRGLRPIGVGCGFRTKINANIGTSADFPDLSAERAKIDLVVASGADAVMDLSTGGDIDQIRRELIAHCPIPFGNVPVYQMGVSLHANGQAFVEMDFSDMEQVLRRQAEDGVDFMTIHAGLTRRALDRVKASGRVTGIVSRGGSLLTAWMMRNHEENPFFTHFDRVLALAHEFDVTLSLGDALRPGCLADGTDWGQLEELMTLGELVKRCREAGVQAMVEGPGHLPIQQVELNIRLQKRICHGAPFYVLGPLLTDIAPGYDHITSAIGGAIAGSAGADFLCYVTPAEHLGLPDDADVREGIMAARIAAHVSDIGKGLPGALDQDLAMARARAALDWPEMERLCLDPQTFRRKRAERATGSEACSMCGDLCVFRILKDFPESWGK